MPQKKVNKKKNDSGLIFGLIGVIGLGIYALMSGTETAFGGTTKYINNETGQISKYYNISDVTKSATASKLNYAPQFAPPGNIWTNAALLATVLLDKIKENLPGMLVINSWYRSPFINTEVGGVDDSYHLYALAVDLDYYSNGVKRNDILIGEIVKILGVGNWNELILEYGNESNPNAVHLAWDDLPASQQKGEIFFKNDSGQYLARSKDWIQSKFA